MPGIARAMSACHFIATQEIHMSKRLPAAIATAALCSIFGTAYAQQSPMTPEPTTEPQPVIVPSITTSTTIYQRAEMPSERGEVKAETLSAMRSSQIPHGELSTPEQDKGAERGLSPLERGLTPR
jgi:hypothetical protein